jgi:hypothetical protein
LSGWFQIQKRIQNLLENDFGNLEKEKEKEILFYSAFWPNSARAPAPALSRAWPIFASPLPALGRAQRAPLAQLARALPAFPCVSLTPRARVSDAFFLPTLVLDILPCSPPIESASHIPSFLV